MEIFSVKPSFYLFSVLMKKLLRNIIFFFIPIIVVIAILPVDKRLKYQGLKDDCFNHGIWIYDRLFNNEKPIDIAFIGSSHTINGINDKLINENIECGKVVNLGYCRLGRNLSYVFLKELLTQKHIKHLILEVREDEDRYSHPIFPYVANSRDVLLPNPFFNRDILADIWTHLSYKTEIFQDIIYKQEKYAPLSTNDFGIASSNDTATSTYLDEIALKRSVLKPPLTKLERNFHMNFARKYLSKISKLCNKNNVQISFLYLPAYGSPYEKPKEFETYSKYGEILIVPKNILENKNNWHDDGHLNQAGAKELSLWLSDHINNNWR
ncbi:MAG: hypothetical protein HC896_06000 [Bacteroidales bacterium]|nr:hypothetical protein [Bacteroidales bacterium]